MQRAYSLWKKERSEILSRYLDGGSSPFSSFDYTFSHLLTLTQPTILIYLSAKSLSNFSNPVLRGNPFTRKVRRERTFWNEKRRRRLPKPKPMVPFLTQFSSLITISGRGLI